MKIVQVIAVVATKYGGPSTGSIELNKALNAMGADAIILTSRLNSGDASLTDSDVEDLRNGGANVLAFKPSAPRRLQNSWSLLRAIYSEVRGADLVHMHGQYLIPHAAAYIAARRWNVRFGVQPHGGLEPYQRAQSRAQKAVYGWLVGNRILRDATYIQFASRSEAENAADIVADRQVRVAPLGATLPPPRKRPDVEDWLAGRQRAETFLFLGRLARKKRPDRLIESWAESGIGRRGARLIIAGPDDEFTQDQLRELSRVLGVEDEVYFTGRVDPNERSWLYSKAGTFVLPSENENFALTVAEAMLAGCCTIATRQVAASTYVSESDGGMVLDSPTELTNALSRAAGDTRATHQAGERAQEFASVRLNWDALARSVMGNPADRSASATARVS